MTPALHTSTKIAPLRPKPWRDALVCAELMLELSPGLNAYEVLIAEAAFAHIPASEIAAFIDWALPALRP
jgi:hypothetical protein